MKTKSTYNYIEIDLNTPCFTFLKYRKYKRKSDDDMCQLNKNKLLEVIIEMNLILGKTTARC